MRPKILAVDDSKAVRMIIQRTFSPYECDILEAGDGEEGLAVAAAESPNLILLDITMPVMDGCEMLVKLKESPTLHSIPVIMLTAEAGKEMVIKITKMGVRDYIVKPFEESFLVEKVARVIELRPVQKSIAGRTKQWGEPCDVLVIEDQPMIIEKLKSAFAPFNWTVRAAANQAQALAAVEQKCPDAVLMSLTLPGQTTWEIHSALKKNAQLSAVSFFGMALKTATAEQAQAQRVGFSGTFSKPLDVNELEYSLAVAMKLDLSARYFLFRRTI